MKLLLTNGYPYPYPEGLSEEESERLSEQAPGNQLELHSVKHFEWLHTVTIEFDNALGVLEAKAKTGWTTWNNGLVLEAKTSTGDGYGHPAIVAGDIAYCGFILVK